ncbi:MAG: glycosyltransferase family 4 protein, partial [Lentisphaerae bacterium]|nr:glycosyltransferase family 4 protein [Lentisphaerota bacterium]
MKKAPRVLMAVYKFYPAIGGAERQCLALSRALRDRGLDVHVATFRLSGDWPRRDLVEGVPVTRLPRLVPAEANLAVWGAFLLANRSRYDVIHVHEANQAATVAANWVRGLCGIPYVVKFVNSGPRFDLRLARETKRWPLRSWITRGTLAANATIAITDGIGREAGDAGLPADRVIRIPNGVAIAGETTREEKVAARKRLGIPEDRLVVLRVGTLKPKKGVPVLLDAWERVIGERRDALLVSIGGERVPAELRTKFEALGSDVRFVPEQPAG